MIWFNRIKNKASRVASAALSGVGRVPSSIQALYQNQSKEE